MNDEIKEILDNMFHIIMKYEEDFEDLEENEIRYQLSYNKMQKLYDYITNLQKANKNHSKKLIELGDKKTNLQQENDKLNRQIVIMEKYLELIYNLGFDCDGYSDKVHLKKLIDELVRFASLGRACNDTEGIYIDNDNIYYNILNERIERGDGK